MDLFSALIPLLLHHRLAQSGGVLQENLLHLLPRSILTVIATAPAVRYHSKSGADNPTPVININNGSGAGRGHTWQPLSPPTTPPHFCLLFLQHFGCSFLPT